MDEENKFSKKYSVNLLTAFDTFKMPKDLQKCTVALWAGGCHGSEPVGFEAEDLL